MLLNLTLSHIKTQTKVITKNNLLDTKHLNVFSSQNLPINGNIINSSLFHLFENGKLKDKISLNTKKTSTDLETTSKAETPQKKKKTTQVSKEKKSKEETIDKTDIKQIKAKKSKIESVDDVSEVVPKSKNIHNHQGKSQNNKKQKSNPDEIDDGETLIHTSKFIPSLIPSLIGLLVISLFIYVLACQGKQDQNNESQSLIDGDNDPLLQGTEDDFKDMAKLDSLKPLSPQ